MAILESEMQFRHSGGAGNSDPDADLGAGMSNTTLTDATFNNMFDDVGAQEAEDGDIEYRGIFLYNANTTETLTNPVVWISASTTAPGDEWAICTDTAGVMSTPTMSSISVEDNTPTETGSWETFSVTISIASEMGPQQGIGIWVRRTVNASAASDPAVTASLAFKGETA